MFLAFKSLRSGSSGNFYLLRSENTTIAIDMGLRSQKLIRAVLEDAGVKPGELEAVIISHTHGDHLSYPGMRVCEANDVPVFLPQPLVNEAARIYASKTGSRPPGHLLRGFGLTEPIVFKDVKITPFVVPHDVVPTVGFRFQLAGQQGGPVITMATDLGHVPEQVAKRFRNSDLLVIEANYDRQMLAASPRDFRHKQRVAGPNGHLSNEDSARAILDVSRHGRPPEYVMLVHLSRDHNTPELALDTVKGYLFARAGLQPTVTVASRSDASEWITVF